jgi:nucleotide-binding universal stress UspA family protein
MLKSLLLLLDGAHCAQGLSELGVSLASVSQARLRGLAMLDMRRVLHAAGCEAASGCCTELQLLQTVERCQNRALEQLTAACVGTKVDFDIRRVKGDPFDILPSEAQFHDLTIAPLPLANSVVAHEQSLPAADVLKLLAAGVKPLLVLRTPLAPIKRVLLVSDGGAHSTTAVREYLRYDLFPQAERRLFAISETDTRAKSLLREMVDYARQRRVRFESGWARGTARQAVVRYAEKWQADLVVIGYRPQHVLLRPLWPQPAEQILRHTGMALFASG